MSDELSVDRYFTIDEARALLPQLLTLADEFVTLRAELTEMTHASPRMGFPLADVKAIEAQVADLLDRMGQLGVQVKGWAPLLADFPMQFGSRVLLLCWLEGDRELEWYHDAEHGFAGRRRLRELGY